MNKKVSERQKRIYRFLKRYLGISWAGFIMGFYLTDIDLTEIL